MTVYGNYDVIAFKFCIQIFTVFLGGVTAIFTYLLDFYNAFFDHVSSISTL
jgi:hypothetical protein